MARLNVECADPSLLRDCIPGQKWKCINDDGRWRKHKCKFHREVQNHLAEVNKYLNVHGKRNCACFTPDGVVYTKIKTEREFFKPKQKRADRHRHQNRHRSKRSTAHDADEIFIDQLPTDFLELLRMDEVVGNLQTALLNQNQTLLHHEHSTRNKRETKDYVTQTLDELTTLLGSIERKYANSSVDPVQCFVESMGSVNCSTNVYENEDAWKQSRIQIDMLIKLLKSKITDLKDIKKHLKEHRPSNITFDDDIYENFSLSAEEIDEIKEITKAPKRKLSTTLGPKLKLTEISSSTVNENTPTTTTQKMRNRTKIMRKTTTEMIPMTVTESSSSVPFTSDSNFDYSTFNEMSSIVDSTTDNLKTSTTITPQVMRETFVTMDTSVYETTTTTKTHENSTQVEDDDDEKNIPAECYCEPEQNK